MIQRRRFVLGFLLLLVGCNAPSQGQLRQALRDAGPSETDDAVVALAAGDMLCTGFFVSPNVIVTASHCVAQKLRAGCGPYWSALLGPKRVMVLPGRLPNPETTTPLAVARVVGREDAPNVCGFDVAALVLEEPVDIEPLVPRFDTGPEVGESLQLVGYGLDPDDETAIGTRRRIDGSRVNKLGSGPPDQAVGLFDGEFQVDFGPCGGDSGGPAMDTSGRVIGVMSRGQQNVCENMTYERIDTQREWLGKVVREAAEAEGLAPPGWAEGAAAPAAESEDAGAPASDATNGTESSGCTMHSKRPAAITLFGMALIGGVLAARRRRSQGL